MSVEIAQEEEMEKSMASNSISKMCERIDLAESCMVACMFEEATSLVCSLIEDICTFSSTDETASSQLEEILESAGMVLIQSLKGSGRTSELFDKLKTLFGSVREIPVNFLLKGAYMQISEGFSSRLKAILEEYLDQWRYSNGEAYVRPKDKQNSYSSGSFGEVMEVSKYIEVAEVYAVTLLGTILDKPKLAVSWVERTELPEEERQDMLRKLHSLELTRKSTSSLDPQTSQTTERMTDHSTSRNGSRISGTTELPQIVNRPFHAGGNLSDQDITKLSSPSTKHVPYWISPYLWWYRSVHRKFGPHLIYSSGKAMLLLSLAFFTYYILRKRRKSLFERKSVKWNFSRQVTSIRKTLFDAWQLAFSFQLNPLAAVQPLPSTPNSSR